MATADRNEATPTSGEAEEETEELFLSTGNTKAEVIIGVKETNRMRHGIVLMGVVDDLVDEVVSGKVKGEKQENFEMHVLAAEREAADTSGLPGFTFGVGERFPAHKDKNMRDMPGPGQYTPKDPKLIGKTPGPRGGRAFGSRTMTGDEVYQKRQMTPAPNKYNPSCEIGKERLSRDFTFGASARGDPSGGNGLDHCAPGPGAYTVPSPRELNGKKGFFRYAETRHVPRKPLRGNHPGPSPAEYDVDKKDSKLASHPTPASIKIGTSQRKGLSDTERTPGPGAYEPNYITDVDMGGATARSQPASVRMAIEEGRAATARARISAEPIGPPTGFGVPTNVSKKAFANAPAFSMSARPSTKRRVTSTTPGPGQYVREGMGDESKKNFTFGTKPSAKAQAILLAEAGRDAPGPGKYVVKHIDPNSPAYSISSKYFPPSHVAGAEDNGSRGYVDPTSPGPIYEPRDPNHQSGRGALFGPRSAGQRSQLKQKLEHLSAELRGANGGPSRSPGHAGLTGGYGPGPGRYTPHKPFGKAGAKFSMGSRTYGPGYSRDGLGAETGKAGFSGGPGPAYDVGHFPDNQQAFVFNSRRKYHGGELRIGGVPAETTPGPYDTRTAWGTGPGVRLPPHGSSSPSPDHSPKGKNSSSVPGLDLSKLR